jgi:hypothetical protein
VLRPRTQPLAVTWVTMRLKSGNAVDSFWHGVRDPVRLRASVLVSAVGNPIRSDFTQIDSRTLSGAAALHPLNASVEIIPTARSSNLLSERGGQHFDRGRDAIEKLVVVVIHLFPALTGKPIDAIY